MTKFDETRRRFISSSGQILFGLTTRLKKCFYPRYDYHKIRVPNRKPAAPKLFHGTDAGTAFDAEITATVKIFKEQGVSHDFFFHAGKRRKILFFMKHRATAILLGEQTKQLSEAVQN